MNKRPYEYTAEVALAALTADEKIQKYILRHLGEKEWAQDIADQLADAYDFSDGDAYKMTKNLDERHCWEADDGLVDLCEMVIAAISRHYQRVTVPDWIKASGITSPFAVGDKVTHARYGEGEVTKIEETYGRNHIHFPEQAGKAIGHGYIATIIYWESTEVKKV